MLSSILAIVFVLRWRYPAANFINKRMLYVLADFIQKQNINW